LVSSFAGWNAIYPEAAALAQAVLKRGSLDRSMPLMEFYLYPPKYISLAAIATLAPPSVQRSDEAYSDLASNITLAAFDNVSATIDGKRHRSMGRSPA
jgi:hypothetical protein